ncbi:Arm DNA-binding domain-containing protein [Cronobacter sakazakii]|nr:Arm DNA-binding domain-containing protein [Cronobacter sakazakii]
MPLTDTKIRNAKPHEKPYSLQDGQGLYLDVRPTGAKIWRYRFWLSPKKRRALYDRRVPWRLPG